LNFARSALGFQFAGEDEHAEEARVPDRGVQAPRGGRSQVCREDVEGSRTCYPRDIQPQRQWP